MTPEIKLMTALVDALVKYLAERVVWTQGSGAGGSNVRTPQGKGPPPPPPREGNYIYVLKKGA